MNILDITALAVSLVMFIINLVIEAAATLVAALKAIDALVQLGSKIALADLAALKVVRAWVVLCSIAGLRDVIP